MKKIFTLALFVLSTVYVFSANTNKIESKTKSFADGVTAIHEDLTGAISTIHDDTKGIVTTLYTDGKEAMIDLYPDVKNAIVSIAKGIGVAAEHVYTVLVKKYVVDGIKELFLMIIGLVLLIIGWVKLDKLIKKNEPIDWHILYPGIMCIASICCLCNVDYTVMFIGLINPEWGAIDYILEYSKTLIGK